MSSVFQPVIGLGNWLWGLIAAIVVWLFGQEFAHLVECLALGAE